MPGREGLAELRPHRGAVVTPLDTDSFREISEMRAVLEPLALRLLEQHIFIANTKMLATLPPIPEE